MQHRSPLKNKSKKEKTDVELGIHIPDVEKATDTGTFENFYEGEKAILNAFIQSTKNLYQQSMENFFSEQKMKVYFLVKQSLIQNSPKYINQNFFQSLKRRI